MRLGRAVLIALLAALFFGANPHPAAAGDEASVVWFFWGDGCVHCAAQEPYVEGWVERYPELDIRSVEVWHDPANRALFAEQAARRDVEVQGVPTTFIGDQVWVGFHLHMLPEMEAALERLAAAAPPAPDADTTHLPLLGEVDVRTHSLVALTAGVAFVDGFNPCSLWVLSVLLALVVRTASRRNVVVVGVTCLTVTALVYVLFIAGVFTVLSYIAYLGWVRAAVATLAIGYGGCPARCGTSVGDLRLLHRRFRL